jgi:hypothetical protein
MELAGHVLAFLPAMVLYFQAVKLFWRLLGEIQSGTLEQVPAASWLVAAAGRVVAALIETLIVVAAIYSTVSAFVPLQRLESCRTAASRPARRDQRWLLADHRRDDPGLEAHPDASGRHPAPDVDLRHLRAAHPHHAGLVHRPRPRLPGHQRRVQPLRRAHRPPSRHRAMGHRRPGLAAAHHRRLPAGGILVFRAG